MSQYSRQSDGYFAQRSLRRHAGVVHLWALGVGAVISGDFFGWNFGFLAGGFGGMLMALVLVTLLYIGLSFSLAEMSPALPHAGGAYSFARTTMGPWGGYITGLAENMEYILTPATIVVGVGGYLGAIFGTAPRYAPVWWLGCYVVFFALWLYLGIEQLPLAAEESHDPKRDMPKGILWGLATLIVCSFLTPILSGGIAPGTAAVGASSEPLFLGFQTIFGAGARAKLLAL